MIARAYFGLLLFLITGMLAAQAPVLEFRNGHFFNGKTFQDGVWYSVNGVLRSKKPPVVDTVIDLQGRWVIPAMGDAYSLCIADNNLAPRLADLYAEEGFQYILVAGNTLEGRAEAEKLLGAAGKPDAAFSNGVITCRGGEPILDYEARAAKVFVPEQIEQKKAELMSAGIMSGNGYWTFNTPEDIKNQWSKLLLQKPDVLLLQLRDATANNGRSLSPDIAKALVKNGRKAKLPVYALIETAEDLRLALKIGANGVIGLPGADWDGQGDPPAALSDADLAQLAKKHTVVVPLLSRLQSRQTGNSKAAQTRQAEQLKRLFDKNVNVCLGSGDVQRTGRNELNYWFQLGGLDYAQTLKALCENTPQAVFPRRKIGRIADGYEANLVVLQENPLVNLLKVRAVAFQLKKGRLVSR